MKQEITLKKLLFRISTLEELGEVLSSQEGFRENIKISLYSVMGSLPVSKGALFLYNARRHRLDLEASRGLFLKHNPFLPLTGKMVELLRKRRKAIVVRERTSRVASFLRKAEPVLETLGAEVLMPMKFRNELIGLIALGAKFSGDSFSEEDFDLLAIMANYIAIGIHNQDLFTHLEARNDALRKKAAQNRRLYRNLEGLYHDTIKALGAAIDAKDPYMRGHSDRVASFADVIARRLGLGKREITAVRIASYLHDIGKIAIDNSILLKPARLNDQEMDQIVRHPTISYNILSNIKFPYPDVALIARHHHEWVNGAGYPDRISVKKLNTGMKILGLADAFDAMTSDRPYRPALDLEKALEEVSNNINVQFDHTVSRAFFDILEEEITGQSASQAIIPHIRSRFSPNRVERLLGKVTAELGAYPNHSRAG